MFVGSALDEQFNSKPKQSAEIMHGALAVIEVTRASGLPQKCYEGP